MGRPTKRNPATFRRLIDAVAAGNTLRDSCAAAGVDYSTFRKWMVEGETQTSGPLHEFFEAIKKAEADAIARYVARIEKAAADSWQAAAWYLERRRPEDWGRGARQSEEAVRLAEEKLRLENELLRAQIAKTTGTSDAPEYDDGFLEALRDEAARAWGDDDGADEDEA